MRRLETSCLSVRFHAQVDEQLECAIRQQCRRFTKAISSGKPAGRLFQAQFLILGRTRWFLDRLCFLESGRGMRVSLGGPYLRRFHKTSRIRIGYRPRSPAGTICSMADFLALATFFSWLK